MRRDYQNLLRDLGFTTPTKLTMAIPALPMLKTGKYDFLVTDWNMPGMSGFDLLKNVPRRRSA